MTSDHLILMLEAISAAEPTRVIPEVGDLDLDARLRLVGQLYTRGWVTAHVFQGGQVSGKEELSLTDDGRRALRDAWNAQDADANDPSGVPLDEKRQRRTRYMKTLYDLTDGNTAAVVASSDVGRALGWVDEITKPVARHLRTKGLIIYRGTGPLVALTPEGVDEAEALIDQPNEPTENLAGLSVSFGDVSGGTVQIAPGGVASVTSTSDAAPQVQSLPRRLAAWIGRNLWLFLVGVAASLVAGWLLVRMFDGGSQANSAPVTIDNRVTNGPVDMREDDKPVRLAREPTLECINDPNCKLAEPTYTSGDEVTAVCQIRSPSQITNGVSADTSDDTNPGLISSNRWYGIRQEGRIWFLNEVWAETEDRGGLGLPRCS